MSHCFTLEIYVQVNQKGWVLVTFPCSQILWFQYWQDGWNGRVSQRIRFPTSMGSRKGVSSEDSETLTPLPFSFFLFSCFPSSRVSDISGRYHRIWTGILILSRWRCFLPFCLHRIPSFFSFATIRTSVVDKLYCIVFSGFGCQSYKYAKDVALNNTFPGFFQLEVVQVELHFKPRYDT